MTLQGENAMSSKSFPLDEATHEKNAGGGERQLGGPLLGIGELSKTV